MAKLGNTEINGDLNIYGKASVNNDDFLPIDNFCNNSGEKLFVPVVLWHGQVYCNSTPSGTTYHSSGVSVSYTYVSTGVMTVTMTGANISSTNDYQVIATGLGIGGNLVCKIGVPSSYKTTTSFRLWFSDDNTTNNGSYGEVCVIKFVQIV